MNPQEEAGSYHETLTREISSGNGAGTGTWHLDALSVEMPILRSRAGRSEVWREKQGPSPQRHNKFHRANPTPAVKTIMRPPLKVDTLPICSVGCGAATP